MVLTIDMIRAAATPACSARALQLQSGRKFAAGMRLRRQGTGQGVVHGIDLMLANHGDCAVAAAAAGIKR